MSWFRSLSSSLLRPLRRPTSSKFNARHYASRPQSTSNWRTAFALGGSAVIACAGIGLLLAKSDQARLKTAPSIQYLLLTPPGPGAGYHQEIADMVLEQMNKAIQSPQDSEVDLPPFLKRDPSTGKLSYVYIPGEDDIYNLVQAVTKLTRRLIGMERDFDSLVLCGSVVGILDNHWQSISTPLESLARLSIAILVTQMHIAHVQTITAALDTLESGVYSKLKADSDFAADDGVDKETKKAELRPILAAEKRITEAMIHLSLWYAASSISAWEERRQRLVGSLNRVETEIFSESVPLNERRMYAMAELMCGLLPVLAASTAQHNDYASAIWLYAYILRLRLPIHLDRTATTAPLLSGHWDLTRTYQREGRTIECPLLLPLTPALRAALERSRHDTGQARWEKLVANGPLRELALDEEKAKEYFVQVEREVKKSREIDPDPGEATDLSG
ncbi:hypothetical protein MKEN_00250000 [Mycena kentingensis (nom. inval.)]|nr:hypothetical protein MKEN_00250000 [Mycena kentingensis (nom. inval.)]